MQWFSSILDWLEAEPWRFAIASAVAAAFVVWILTRMFAPLRTWLNRTLRGLWGLLRRLASFIFTIRITTTGRIKKRIDAAVHLSHNPQSVSPHWKWVLDPRPGVWRLENHRQDDCKVLGVEFDTDVGWTWKIAPRFPRLVAAGAGLEIRGAIKVPPAGIYGRADDPGASVHWENSHGDEDSAWAPFRDGVTF